MLIKYEAEVKDCFNGDIQQKCKMDQLSSITKKWRCCIDGKVFEIIDGKGCYPCQIRPCPIEVEE